MSDPHVEAFGIAEKFLAARHWDPRLASRRIAANRTASKARIFWHGEIPLTAVPLDAVGDEPRGGYLLVASDPRLPSIVEYSETARLPTDTLSAEIKRTYPEVEIERFIFMSSTQLAAEAKYKGKLFLIEFPSLSSSSLAGPYRSGVDPSRLFDKARLEDLRDRLTAAPVVSPAKQVLDNARPVKYNQNCSGYGVQAGAPQLGAEINHCAPKETAGCVPVAWAMWLSSAKRVNAKGAEQIWKNSACWSEDWGSFSAGSNPSKCPEVAATIWKLHSLMATTVNGETSPAKNLAGASVLKDFGLSWKFEQAANCDLDVVANLIPYGFPLIWCAHGNWPGANPPKAGHGVVIYGYDKQAGTVRICMGWGDSFDDRCVNWNQYGDTELIHRTSSIFGGTE